jgi:hypothetical protein
VAMAVKSLVSGGGVGVHDGCLHGPVGGEAVARGVKACRILTCVLRRDWRLHKQHSSAQHGKAPCCRLRTLCPLRPVSGGDYGMKGFAQPACQDHEVHICVCVHLVTNSTSWCQHCCMHTQGAS